MKLRHTGVLHPKLPFHFAGTVCKPSHFPAPVDWFEGGEYGFCLRSGEEVFGIKLGPVESEGEVPIAIYGESDPPVEAVEREVTYRFGMDLELSPFVALAGSDPALRAVESRWRGTRSSCAYSLYELLCVSIVLQNAAVSRSVRMLAALLERYGTPVEFAGRRLYAFWQPETLAAVSEEELRALKVGYRAKSFLRVSQFFAAHPGFEATLRSLPKEEASRALRQIYGVGPASVWYLLFGALRHMDAFDYISPWEQKILSRLMFNAELVPAEQILAVARERWGEWRMLAVHYLFEDVFWRRRNEPVDWLEQLIRL